jgi:hypothetical protein
LAKKKRKQPARAGQRPGAATQRSGAIGEARPSAATSRGAKEPPAVTVAPTSEGGPNRQARKEEARRRREALRRKMARRRAMRIVGMVTVLAVIVAAVALYFTVFRTTAAEAAGCAPVRKTGFYQHKQAQDRLHIGAAGSPITKSPPLSTYASIPPASGPHNPTPLDAGEYSRAPDIYRAIHSLEHGAVEVWYSPSIASSSEVAKIRSFYQQPTEQDHVIAAPYNYPRAGGPGHLPAGDAFALVAWHHIELCRHPSLAVVKDFVRDYRVPTGQVIPPTYKGDAPEAGLAI